MIASGNCESNRVLTNSQGGSLMIPLDKWKITDVNIALQILLDDVTSHTSVSVVVANVNISPHPYLI